MTVFVLDRHAPPCKLHHLAPVLSVEVEQGSLLQAGLGRISDTDPENFNATLQKKIKFVCL